MINLRENGLAALNGGRESLLGFSFFAYKTNAYIGGDDMLKIEKPGYHIGTVTEPLILEETDYKDEPKKWEVLKEICGFTARDKVSRILLNISSIEYYVEES